MASEYYKWLARNEKPEEVKELTPEEKRRNWWDYHKWHVVIAIVCVLLAVDFVGDIVSGYLNEPDYRIAYVGTVTLPDDMVEAIEAAFAELGEDITENGKVQVELQQYVFAASDENDTVLTEQTAEAAYSGTMQLTTDIQTAQSVIFLLEDPETFRLDYGVLDGDGYRRWGDCPVLTELELGNYVLTGLMEAYEGSNQEALADLYIARRSFQNNESSPEIDGAIALYELLTEGTE